MTTSATASPQCRVHTDARLAVHDSEELHNAMAELLAGNVIVHGQNSRDIDIELDQSTFWLDLTDSTVMPGQGMEVQFDLPDRNIFDMRINLDIISVGWTPATCGRNNHMVMAVAATITNWS